MELLVCKQGTVICKGSSVISPGYQFIRLKSAVILQRVVKMMTLSTVIMSLLRRNKWNVLGEGRGTFCSDSSSYSHSNLMDMATGIIPTLSSTKYKGQCGRLGVLGGCKEYTGAPYFAAISMLKVGADLSHVFCTEGAGVVIKSYSPELIVHPVLDHSDGASEISHWLGRMHSLVIGPGLGRDKKLFDNVKAVLEKAKELQLPLVIDADGVFFLTQQPQLIHSYTQAILTPNAVEFAKLYESVLGSCPSGDDLVSNTRQLSQALGNVTIVRKGPEDIISNGEQVLTCSFEGSPRRCGGQGDLLSGSMGAFTYWAHQARDKNNSILGELPPTLCAAYAACCLTRRCSRDAFHLHGRSMTTSDMINQIHTAFDNLFPAHGFKSSL